MLDEVRRPMSRQVRESKVMPQGIARQFRVPKGALLAAVAVSLLGAMAQEAVAQAGPSNPFSYTVTTNYTYRTDGKLDTTTIAPTLPELCSVATEAYDAYGNRTGRKLSNCAGATGAAVFAERNETGATPAVSGQNITVAGSQVAVSFPAGLFVSELKNSASQTETRKFDPRFGAVVQATAINKQSTNYEFDDFGRMTRELKADGTSSVSLYCILASAGVDTSSNSSGCPAPASGEAPPDAVRYIQSEPRDKAGVKMGSFIRVYIDRLGRALRKVTESFDGTGQTAGRAGVLVATDTVYAISGVKSLETEPYFLSSGARSTGGAADVGAQSFTYDALGRLVTTYLTDLAGLAGTRQFGDGAGVSYGHYGARRSAKAESKYSGLTLVHTNDKGQVRTTELNPIGQAVRITDANGAQLAHLYEAFGGLKKTQDALGNQTSVTYDWLGHRTQLVDPDKGTWNYSFDPLGQVLTQKGPNDVAKGTSTAVSYDALGRVKSRASPENVSTWTYDTCTNGVGRLCSVSNTNGAVKKYTYDSLGRPVNKLVSATGIALPSAFGYDGNTGRLSSITYPSGLKVGYAYTKRGYVEKLALQTAAAVNPLPAVVGGTPGPSMNLPSGSMLWQASSVDAAGGVEKQLFGNSVEQRTTYQPGVGRITDIAAGVGTATNVLKQHYSWDSLTNLVARSDGNGDGNTGAVSEAFEYADNLNRLTSYTVSAPALPNLERTVNLQYNALGMLLGKSDVGNYTYVASGAGAVRPHAVQSVAGKVNVTFGYDANGNTSTATSGGFSKISYTSFDLPDGVGISGRTNGLSYSYAYDESFARLKEVHSALSADGVNKDVRTTWYDHPDAMGGLGFEYEVNTPAKASQATPLVNVSRHYVSVAGNLVGVLVSEGTLSATATVPPTISTITLRKVEYSHRDFLGNTISTTDHGGAVTMRYAYDPFGKRRYTNGTYDEFGKLIVDWSPVVNSGTDRGFTGHEHLDDVGLIHMNGRLFNPLIGTFMQADKLVPNSWGLQSFNRYGYCLNNPMSCTDPSGFDSLELSEGVADAESPPAEHHPVVYLCATDLCRMQAISSEARLMLIGDGSGGGYGEYRGSSGYARTPISVPAMDIGLQSYYAMTSYVNATSNATIAGVNASIDAMLQAQQLQAQAAMDAALQNAAALQQQAIAAGIAAAQTAAAQAAARPKLGPIGAVYGASNASNLLHNRSKAVGGFSAPSLGDTFRAAVTAAQFVPVLQTAAGLVGAAVDIYDGHYWAAALSVGTMVPGIGEAFAGIRAARVAAKGLPDAALVCRGGACKVENFLSGSGVTRAADGTLSGVSTQSKAGASISELAKPFKNNQVGVTTVGDIRRAGGRVTADGHAGNPNHATVDGLTAEQLERLFTPTMSNPVPPGLRGL